MPPEMPLSGCGGLPVCVVGGALLTRQQPVINPVGLPCSLIQPVLPAIPPRQMVGVDTGPAVTAMTHHDVERESQMEAERLTCFPHR